MYCRNRPNVISNDLKCAGGWGSAPDPAGGAYDAPPAPLIVRGNTPSALGTLYFVSIFTSQFPFRAPPYGIPGSATGYRQLQVKDLPKVPTWRLERNSNPRPSGRKASTLPMRHYAQRIYIKHDAFMNHAPLTNVP